MIIKEYISRANKNQMINILLKHHKVANVKVKLKSMPDFAHYDVDRGTLELSTKYKSIKTNQIEEFLITMLHEIYHAMDAKKYGWKKFKDMYEYEMAVQIANDKDQYKDNKFEIAAEDYGQKNWRKWFKRFKAEKLF
jgi:hypothetical protein